MVNIQTGKNFLNKKHFNDKFLIKIRWILNMINAINTFYTVNLFLFRQLFETKNKIYLSLIFILS